MGVVEVVALLAPAVGPAWVPGLVVLGVGVALTGVEMAVATEAVVADAGDVVGVVVKLNEIIVIMANALLLWLLWCSFHHSIYHSFFLYLSYFM